MEAVLPVGEDVRHWHAQPALGHRLPDPRRHDGHRGVLGARRNVTLPGVSCTVGEQIEALRKVAGDKVVARIRREPNETIMKIVSAAGRGTSRPSAGANWASRPSSFEEIIAYHIADELGGKIA
jgi:hypothetical protein